MRWHLIDAAGSSLRTCEASCVAEARFRLAPIPKDCGVVSDASYWVPVRRPLTDAEAKGLANELVRRKATPAKAERWKQYAARRWPDGQPTKRERSISGKHRQAIRDGNTRRVLERMKARATLT